MSLNLPFLMSFSTFLFTIVLWCLVVPAIILILELMWRRNMKRLTYILAVLVMFIGVGLEFDSHSHILSWLTLPLVCVFTYSKFRNPVAALSGVVAFAWMHEFFWFYIGVAPSFHFVLTTVYPIYYILITGTLCGLFYILYLPSRFYVPIVVMWGFTLIWALNGFPYAGPVNQIPTTPSDYFAVASWWAGLAGWWFIRPRIRK